MIKMSSGLHVKYPLILSDFNETCIFLTVFWKNTQILSFMKIRPVGAEFFHADRRTDGRADARTDITKLIVASRSFANAPQNDNGNVKLKVYRDVIRNATAYTLLHIPFK